MTDTIYYEKTVRIFIWGIIVTAFILAVSCYACNNITPIQMAKVGFCYDGASMQYKPCAEKK